MSGHQSHPPGFYFAGKDAFGSSHHCFADLELCSKTSPCSTCLRFNKQPCKDGRCTDEQPCLVCSTVPPEYRRHRCYAWEPLPNFVLRGNLLYEQYAARVTRDLWTAVQMVPWDARAQQSFCRGTLPPDVVRLDPPPGPGLLYETVASAVRAHNIRVFCEDKPYSQPFSYVNPALSSHWVYGCCLIPADGCAGPVVGTQLPPPPQVPASMTDYVWTRQWVRRQASKKQKMEGEVPMAQRPFLPSRKTPTSR